MIRSKLSVVASSLAILWAGALTNSTAIAAPILFISGDLSLLGIGARPQQGGVTLANWGALGGSAASWSGVDFGASNIVTFSSDAFAGFSMGTPVTFTDPTTFDTPGVLFSANDGARTVTYTWSSVSKAYNAGTDTYSLLFKGTMDLSGSDPTYAPTNYSVGWSSAYNFSTFSVNANPVPAPASLALLGVGLLGLAGVARRSRKTAQI